MEAEHRNAAERAPHALQRKGNVLLEMSVAMADQAILRRVEDSLNEMSGECSRGFGAIIVIAQRGGAVSPNEDVRSAMSRCLADRPGLHAIAFVIEADGFTGAGLRLIVSGLLLSLRKRYAIQVFSGVDEAATWLVSQLRPRAPDSPGVPAILAALRVLRAAASAD